MWEAQQCILHVHNQMIFEIWDSEGIFCLLGVIYTYKPRNTVALSISPLLFTSFIIFTGWSTLGRIRQFFIFIWHLGVLYTHTYTPRNALSIRLPAFVSLYSQAEALLANCLHVDWQLFTWHLGDLYTYTFSTPRNMVALSFLPLVFISLYWQAEALLEDCWQLFN